MEIFLFRQGFLFTNNFQKLLIFRGQIFKVFFSLFIIVDIPCPFIATPYYLYSLCREFNRLSSGHRDPCSIIDFDCFISTEV
jgi:hypothetical protein